MQLTRPNEIETYSYLSVSTVLTSFGRLATVNHFWSSRRPVGLVDVRTGMVMILVALNRIVES